MKTLYLSDLDGTLLRSDERVSEYSANIINRFVENGGCFSYATARSIVTSSKVAAGLSADLPVICGNGAFIYSGKTREMLMSNFFSAEEVKFAREILESREIYPLTGAYIDGGECKSYIPRLLTPAMKQFLMNRIGDPRLRKAENGDALYSGEIYRIACMDSYAALAELEDIFGEDARFCCVFQKEVYSGECWCDILPAKATKAAAALQLKEMLGCERLVVFGDEHNDISLFSVADESYATANAVPALKAIATAVIGSNDDDGVARWMEKYAAKDCV